MDFLDLYILGLFSVLDRVDPLHRQKRCPGLLFLSVWDYVFYNCL